LDAEGQPVFPAPRRPTHQGQTAGEEEIAMTLDYDEFLAEVHRDAELPGQDDAVRHAVAVFAALRLATGPGELRRLEDELPKDYRALLAAAEPDGGPPPAETFIPRVVAYGALDLSSAWAAASSASARGAAARPTSWPRR
jgi:uncharacterized protein (DUF2267 family)